MSELRPYQVTAIDSALAALSNSGSVVMQMPTGAGKTRAATEIVGHWDGVVWFVCHRVEIAQQTAKAFKAAGIEFGMISPRAIDPDTDKPYPFEPGKRVQIITIGTLPRLLADLLVPSLVVWDECHHVAAESWAEIRQMLTDAKHLGLTATPERLDGKGLSKWFSELVVGPAIESLIADEWLSPFRYFAPSDPDLSAAKMQAGDYNKKYLAKVMNTPVLIGDAVAEYRRVADGKRAIAFCASKEASRALVERFNAEGVPALHVDGDTHPTARREAVKALTAGDIKVLSNVEVFTEGFDVPGIEAVILMRPTKSPTLLLQMIGRALRFVEGKTAVIMDHAGLWQDHGNFARYESWSIKGGAVDARRRSGVGGLRWCPKCKHVPFERVPVCANCGYEFPSGREVGEYDGVLREVSGVVPEGCETIEAFSRRCGVQSNTVKRWIRDGLPTAGRYIPIHPALEWVESTWNSNQHPPRGVGGEFESLVKFSARFGYSSGIKSTLKSLGFPHFAGNGWVEVVPGTKWMLENWRSNKTPPVGLDHSKYESQVSFAGRMDIGQSVVARCIRDGMPAAPNGWVEIEPAITWFQLNYSTNQRPPSNAEHPDEWESQYAFSKRVGVSDGLIAKWATVGMPTGANGWVHVESCLLWAKENRPQFFRDSTRLTAPEFGRRVGASDVTVRSWRRIGLPSDRFGMIDLAEGEDWLAEYNSPYIPPRGVARPEDYEPRYKFTQRLGLKSLPVAWGKGLPCASNGWVHIHRGLEWVRDNTSITIPPEAWPSANDNAAAADSAAA